MPKTFKRCSDSVQLLFIFACFLTKIILRAVRIKQPLKQLGLLLLATKKVPHQLLILQEQETGAKRQKTWPET